MLEMNWDGEAVKEKSFERKYGFGWDNAECDSAVSWRLNKKLNGGRRV
jgi:hypothetical protein